MNNQVEYITIAELSRLTGKSKQYIYKILSTKLKDYCTTKGNQRMIDKKAIKEVFGIGEVEQQEEQPKSTNLNQEYINSLKEQIAELKADKLVKDKQIEELNRALNQSQILHARDQEKILLLEQKAEEQQENLEQEPHKKRWWKFGR